MTADHRSTLPHLDREATVCILGAGPHGLAATVHLLAARPELSDEIVVLDPAGQWMDNWREQFARLEIANLRSPVVHHPGVDPGELATHTIRHRLDRSGLPYDLPTTKAFASFCQDLIAGMKLNQPQAATARRVVPTGDRLAVETDTGTVTCRHLVLATNPHRRQIPDWVGPILGRLPGAIDHAANVDLRTVGNLAGATVLVVGGGLTAAHLTLGAAARGACVELVSRRPIETRSFDTDPGWLGPRFLKDYSAEPDPAARHRQALAARGGGTMPDWIHQRLMDLVTKGCLRLHEGRQVVEAGAVDGRTAVDLDDGSSLEADLVWLATGTTADIEAQRALDPILPDVASVAGMPICDRDLRIGRYPIHVMGRLATLTLGPAAGNLWGARFAARAIAKAITGVDLENKTPTTAVTPGTEECGVDRFVYRSRWPFHPQRLYNALTSGDWDGVLRSKGVFWVSSRPDIQVLWQQAASAVVLEPTSPWLASVPREQWRLEADELAELDERWDPLVGDRATELAFVGTDMKEQAIVAALDACVLTGDEISQGFDGWASHPDPLPIWDLDQDLDQDFDEDIDEDVGIDDEGPSQ